MLITEEALSSEGRQQISSVFTNQPAWSKVPLLILTSHTTIDREGWHMLRGIERAVRLKLLERPLHIATLVSAVRTAVEVRRQQYQVGNELEARKRAERLLHENQLDLARAQAVSQIGSWRQDGPRQQVIWSKEMHRIFGVPLGATLTYESFLEIVHPDDRQYVDTKWKAALRGEPYDIEHRIIVGGVVKWIRERAYLEHDAAGRMQSGFGIAEDVTDRKMAEEALRSLNETLEQRVAERTAVAEQRARDLRRLATELCEAEHRERTRLAKLLHDDLQQLLLAAQLYLPVLVEGPPDQLPQNVAKINELLKACQQTSRNLSSELSPPILHRGTVLDVLEWLRDWFGEKYGLTVNVETIDSVTALPEHLRIFIFQSARELLTNVVKHSRSKEATIAVSSRGGKFRLRIEDGGRGFNPEAILLKLQRPESFGLFNIRERLEALGGRLEVHRTPLGGACVGLVMPFANGGQTLFEDNEAGLDDMIPTHDRKPQPGEITLRLLVADDHAIVREGLVSLLDRQLDFEVVGEAADGEQAVQQTDILSPDAVIMDVDMPNVDGIEATRRIKRRQPDTLVIGLSLHHEESITRALREAGADGFVSKHAPAQEVIEAIRQTCRRRGDRS